MLSAEVIRLSLLFRAVPFMLHWKMQRLFMSAAEHRIIPFNMQS